MSRRRRPRNQAISATDSAALEIPKTMSPQAEETMWEMVFAMHLAQAIEDRLEAEKNKVQTPPAPEQAG